jgi:glycosyltransferase involved in cell wall biosynthesis
LNTHPKENPTNQNSKRFYYVWNYIEWGGAQIYFLSIMRFVAQNHSVKVILPVNSAEKLLSYLKANNIEFEFFEGNLDLRKSENLRQRIQVRINDYFCNLSLAKHLSKQNLSNSVVHIDVAPWSGFTLLFYLAIKAQVFLTFHTPLPKISNWRKILWKIKFGILTRFENFYLVASNQKVKNSLEPFVSLQKFDQIKVAYSSINLEEIDENLNRKLSREETAEKYQLPQGKFWLCNVGQFIERKGCWVLLDALKDLTKRRKDIYFYWLGTAPLNAEILERVDSYKLDEHFRFFSAEEIGSQRSDLLNFLSASDLFVMPSLEEGLPVALIEAMALGKCSIASDTDAIPEAVEHLKTGFLISPGSKQSVEDAIEMLIDNNPLRVELGENARKKAVEKFDDKKLGGIMLELYEKALEKK